MIYSSASDWMNSKHKRVLVFGMSGLGKTHVSKMLRSEGDWFHYSVDYRIGTHYMGEHIADNFKREAMKNPFLRQLLLTDSIYVASNLSFDNLTPVSTYLGKPGDPAKGGLPFAEYCRRQDQFRRAEIAALLDTPHFIQRAEELYSYPNFICDTGGSICEWVDPDDHDDEIMGTLAQHTLMIWLKGSEAHTAELIRRFDRAPKPMAYQPEFLSRMWTNYLAEKELAETAVDPDDFVRWIYAKALAHRQPRYRAMADRWGLTIEAGDIARMQCVGDFAALVGKALEARR